MGERSDARETVATMLRAAGLELDEAEVEALVEMYSQLRAAADSLDIPEALSQEPALLYSPLEPPPAGDGTPG
ncbi:MAG: hypothetical protein F4150_00280 [Chloroflexi bacterium]|nr:hypothetical protein [Chloroflexota bacterium]